MVLKTSEATGFAGMLSRTGAAGCCARLKLQLGVGDAQVLAVERSPRSPHLFCSSYRFFFPMSAA